MSGQNLLLPEGLSKGKLTDILKKDFGQVSIKYIQEISGSKAGDNNLSEVSRLIVYFTSNNSNEKRSKSFIFKDANKSASEIIHTINGIEKENLWYDKILPEIEKLGIKVGASFHTRSDKWLLLEDLSVEGYKVLDRKAMLDLDHCLKAVEALARFHAVTHYLYETNKLPEIAKKEEVFIPGSEKEIYNNFKYFDKIIDTLTQCGVTKYNDTIKSLQPVAFNKMLQCIHENEEFLCLIQGDYWTTNILFKYNSEKKVSDAKIIDFQLIRLMTPAYDLHFFVCSSVQPEVREYHLDKIYQVYLETLNSTLKLISSKTTLSQEQFDKMMKGTNFMGVFTALTFLPVALCDLPLKFQPPIDLSEEEKKNYNPHAVVYKQANYREHLLRLLDFYKKNDII